MMGYTSSRGRFCQRANLFRDCLGDLGNQRRRNFDPVDFFQVCLDIAGSHPSGVHGDDIVVKAGKPALSLGENDRLE